MIEPGEIISYLQMCQNENANSLQRGMNFGSGGDHSIILMSIRKGAPYEDMVEDNGQILIYEGHDLPKNEAQYPKQNDQSLYTPKGRLTQNGRFVDAAEKYKGGAEPELIRVYEKIKDGIWVYNGVFELVDAWLKNTGERSVYKFKLHITDKTLEEKEIQKQITDLDHNRIIPSSVKLEVWKRDKGQCVSCGSKTNLHFDHILPFSKGGTSLKAENIQLLCARHNLQKSAKIE